MSEPRPLRAFAVAGSSVLAAVALAGCAPSAPKTSEPTKTVTINSTPTATATPSMQTTPQCHAGSVDSSVLPALSKVPKPASVDEWQVYTAQGYDRCAALSWVVLAPKNATASSPFAIMLFHGGEYIGTATKDPQGFAPDITRTSDAAISVTYKYPQGNDANANPTGRTHATFTWDAASGRVVMAGQLPPH